MAGEVTRRKELHDFLKAARARVQPKDLGLTPPRNRRSSGLQQADVAATLNVSPRWYNGFENGATVPGEDMLDQLARILRLTPAERVHLYLLATGHEPVPGQCGAAATVPKRYSPASSARWTTRPSRQWSPTSRGTCSPGTVPCPRGFPIRAPFRPRHAMRSCGHSPARSRASWMTFTASARRTSGGFTWPGQAIPRRPAAGPPHRPASAHPHGPPALEQAADRRVHQLHQPRAVPAPRLRDGGGDRPAQHRVSRRVPPADARALQRMADPAAQPHPPDQAQDQQARRGSPATPMITATAVTSPTCQRWTAAQSPPIQRHRDSASRLRHVSVVDRRRGHRSAWQPGPPSARPYSPPRSPPGSPGGTTALTAASQCCQARASSSVPPG